MNNPEASHCHDCEKLFERTDANFYHYHTKAQTKKYQAVCRDCQKKRMKQNYQPSETGFKKLPKETQDAIIRDWKNGLKKKDIATTYSIPRSTLTTWRTEISQYVRDEEVRKDCERITELMS